MYSLKCSILYTVSNERDQKKGGGKRVQWGVRDITPVGMNMTETYHMSFRCQLGVNNYWIFYAIKKLLFI